VQLGCCPPLERVWAVISARVSISNRNSSDVAMTCCNRSRQLPAVGFLPRTGSATGRLPRPAASSSSAEKPCANRACGERPTETSAPPAPAQARAGVPRALRPDRRDRRRPVRRDPEGWARSRRTGPVVGSWAAASSHERIGQAVCVRRRSRASGPIRLADY
jgi:hypothetical protein